MKRGLIPGLLTPPENAANAELCRRIPRVEPVEHQEWLPMESAPRDGTALIALVNGKEVRVRWARTPHLPLVAFCIEGTEWPCQPDAWRPTGGEGE